MTIICTLRFMSQRKPQLTFKFAYDNEEQRARWERAAKRWGENNSVEISFSAWVRMVLTKAADEELAAGEAKEGKRKK